jgi:actin-related protein 3
MFETFNVPHIYVGTQVMLAIAASWSNKKNISLTGYVAVRGDSITPVIPVLDGYTISNAIQTVPIA